MAMDAKDLRTESALGAHSDDGSTKYAQSVTAFQTNANKTYHEVGSNSLGKADIPAARPCAIIGPDRVVPPQSANVYVKKAPVEPWSSSDGIYQHPPEYPYKSTEYQHARNISPRQTFQENMQRIMVPPSYTSVKNNDDNSLKNPKLLDSKFCDVPYTVSPINNEPKIVKSSEGLVSNNNSNQPVIPNVWASSGINVRPLRPYGAPELYQYSEYPNCPGPRPISMIRPHRNGHEDMPHVYQDRYHEANIRFKPYPTTKERPLQNPHSRYDYIPNYPNAFHTHPAYPPNKYELQKAIPPHSYSVYPPVPLKYLERRMPVPTMEKYSRSPSQQVTLNQPFCNQNIPSNYGPLPGNCLQNRAYPYAPDPSTKNMIQNRFYFDSNSARKYYTSMENMYINDINRTSNMKNDILYPSYPPINIHSLPPHHIYRKENAMKGYEHPINYRNLEYSANNNPLGRIPLQFSPQTMSISPSDSNTSNDTIQILGNAQDDCGYASQSTTSSIRSIDCGVNRISSDVYRRHDISLPHVNKFGRKQDTSVNQKEKKNLDVRQFLQMWNEGDDEGNDNNKETIRQKEPCNSLSRYESHDNQEQLYVLGLVNVPKEELGKYDHIQKISKLPENIKGYNSIELLNQYEKLVESPGLNQFPPTQPKQKELHVPIRSNISRHGMVMSNDSLRPISPLDVEAKISQSVIHKEVGCNFEIRPCSPQMMNVELATPIHNLLGERLIEKVVNPVNITLQQRIEETNTSTTLRNNLKIPSCKMVSNQYPSPNLSDSLKTNYCLQDLESNSGVCLASLPRLDNDIELNFPEINQQFINANKISIRDLPILDTDNGNIHNSKTKFHNQPFISEQLNSGSESDKDTSKLSKYRKQKRNSVPNDNDETSNNSLHRTDSVIIKNPDNVRSQDECINSPSVNSNMSSITNLINFVNVVPESEKALNYTDKNFAGTINKNLNDYTSMDSDTAIDFSLNKSDDEQSNTINGLINLNDALQNNDEINKNIYSNMDKETIHDNLYNKNSSQGVQETSDNFSILQDKSPVLVNENCCSVFNNNEELQSADKDNQIHQTHETVISHSKPKEILPDISLVSVSSLTEEIIPQNDLPSLNCEIENVSKNTTCDVNISENNIAPSNDIDSQALNYCLAEQQNEVITAMCEFKYNLDIENKKDINVEVNSTTQHKEVNKLTMDISQAGAKGHPKAIENDSIDHSKIIKSEDENNVIIKMKNNELPTNIMLHNGKVFDPEIEIEQDNNITDFETNDQVFPNKCSNENLVPPESNNNEICDIEPSNDSIDDSKIIKSEDENNVIIKMENNELPTNIMLHNGKVLDPEIEIEQDNNITDFETNDQIFPNKCSNENLVTPESNEICDIESISVNVFDSTHSLFLENKDIHSKTKTENITVEIKNELSPRTLNVNSFNENIKSDAKSHQGKYEFSFYKKKNSSRIQNLLIYNEGLCTSITKYKKENLETIHNFYSNNNCLLSEKTKEKVTDKTNKEQILDIKSENTISYIISLKNDETASETKTETNTVDCVENEARTTETMPKTIDCDSINSDNDLNTIQKNEITNVSKLFKMSEEEIKNIVPENNIENNIKFSNLIKDNNAENLIENQLPFRRSRTLKRSLSESAVTAYNIDAEDLKGNHNNFIHTKKRPKISDSEILLESQVLTENLTNLIQSNRRNSISTIYNDENVSFCIFIENDCLLSEDNENCEKICYTEIPDDCLTTICAEEDGINSELIDDTSYENTSAICNDEQSLNSDLNPGLYYEDSTSISINMENLSSEINPETMLYEKPEQGVCDLENLEDRTIEESWVEDVACMETVFSDDIAEDIVISAPSSPKDSESSEDESDTTNFVYNINENEHTNKVKHIYGNKMCDDDAQLVEQLYRTPQMDVNKTLVDRESQLLHECNRYYDNESLEKILSESNTLDTFCLLQNQSAPDESLMLPGIINDKDVHGNKENLKDLFPAPETRNEIISIAALPDVIQTKLSEEKKEYKDCLVHSCESSCDNFVSYKKEGKLQYSISSSPEVSSTTSEEKNPAILLKIRNYKGSKISEVNEMSASFNHSNSEIFKNNTLAKSRPLITKAAQKYIPPLKETMHDLKVKIRLPKQSLYKLQQLKKSKEEPKIDTIRNKHIKKLPQETPKKAKPKPKFEDVLMSIDEIQFKKHKAKNKRMKPCVPKVIIKKNENGAHYASTQSKETFNPDLTGRKWQPWVFLEKSNFVDKMALKQKFKAIYSHRKKTFVLAEKFRKYKSISNAKFVISHPKSSDVSSGKLKYTFRLKH